MSLAWDQHARTETEPANVPRAGWGRTALWLLVSALAFLVYELTASPGLAAATACLKFGWEEFITAWWLRRRDPNRPRARALSWLFLASGLWRSAITGVIAMFAVGIVQVIFRPGVNAGAKSLLHAYFACLIVAVLGFLFSMLSTLRAFLGAWWHGLKLWIDPHIHDDRRANRFPPTGDFLRSNRAGAVLLTAIALGLFVSYLLIAGFTIHTLRQQVPAFQAKKGGDLLGMLALLGLMFGVPLLAYVLNRAVRQHTLARSAAECWRDEPTAPRDPFDSYISA